MQAKCRKPHAFDWWNEQGSGQCQRRLDCGEKQSGGPSEGSRLGQWTWQCAGKGRVGAAVCGHASRACQRCELEA